MHRIITGATGLIGKRLTEHWLKSQKKVVVVGRSKQGIKDVFGTRVIPITWDEFTREDLKSAEIVVNLAGANIADKRWTDSRKQEILNSRIKTTQKIANMLAAMGKDAPPFFNASAIGIYGLQQQSTSGLPKAFDEDSPIDWNHPTDFLSRIGRLWEKAAIPADASGARVVFLRFGVVLAREGGALPQLLKPFRFYMGGILGTGFQPFSWVAIEDVISAIDFIFANPALKGAFNIVAPECVTERTLAQTIGKIMHKPAKVTTPTFALEMLMGKELTKELLLEGQHVYPKRLLQLGFQFQYPTIESVLKHVINEPAKEAIV